MSTILCTEIINMIYMYADTHLQNWPRKIIRLNTSINTIWCHHSSLITSHFYVSYVASITTMINVYQKKMPGINGSDFIFRLVNCILRRVLVER